jgi:hypothetical protein
VTLTPAASHHFISLQALVAALAFPGATMGEPDEPLSLADKKPRLLSSASSFVSSLTRCASATSYRHATFHLSPALLRACYLFVVVYRAQRTTSSQTGRATPDRQK